MGYLLTLEEAYHGKEDIKFSTTEQWRGLAKSNGSKPGYC